MCDSAGAPIGRRVRFVLLRHTDRRGIHFDLMIDRGDHLATWQCPRPPEEAGTAGQACTRIADHRRIYLDYEGAISGDRGHVVQHDRGTCVVDERPPGVWRVEFHGERLTGGYVLEREQGSVRREEGGGDRGRGQSWSVRAQ